MNTTRTRAIVLRRTNYGEADRVVQLLTPVGRMAVMAKGVRREKSKLAGGIELFAVADMVIGRGKGELGIVTSARLVQFYRHILEDYDRLQFAYEVLKQAGRGSENIDEPEWYDIVQEVLMALDVKTVSLQLIETWFYIRLSAVLGHELNTQRDYMGQKLAAGQFYRYDASEQGFVLAENGGIGTEHIKILRLCMAKPLQTIIQVGGLQEYLAECLHVAREHAAL